MSTLNEYLEQKRQALLRRREKALSNGAEVLPLRAHVRAEGRSGVRRIRIRDFQILSDSPPNFAGYSLGPGSPELQLGVLGSCLTHVFLIQAAEQQVPLDSLDVEVSGQFQPHTGLPGDEDIPVYPYNIEYTVHITSTASQEQIAALHAAVERVCPILNLLINPQQISGRIALTSPTEATEPVHA